VRGGAITGSPKWITGSNWPKGARVLIAPQLKDEEVYCVTSGGQVLNCESPFTIQDLTPRRRIHLGGEGSCTSIASARTHRVALPLQEGQQRS